MVLGGKSNDFLISFTKHLENFIGRAYAFYETLQLALREKCPNTEFFLAPVQTEYRKYGPDKTPYLKFWDIYTA